MALTREFKATIQARARRDARFRAALLTEAVNALLAGEPDAGKAIMRDYINATIGFARLAQSVDIPSKSLQRMLGPGGNPTAQNLFAVIQALQKLESLTLEVKVSRTAA
jgi:DNA-binding phage protein